MMWMFVELHLRVTLFFLYDLFNINWNMCVVWVKSLVDINWHKDQSLFQQPYSQMHTVVALQICWVVVNETRRLIISKEHGWDLVHILQSNCWAYKFTNIGYEYSLAQPSCLDSSGKEFLPKTYSGNTGFESQREQRLVSAHTLRMSRISRQPLKDRKPVRKLKKKQFEQTTFVPR